MPSPKIMTAQKHSVLFTIFEYCFVFSSMLTSDTDLKKAQAVYVIVVMLSQMQRSCWEQLAQPRKFPGLHHCQKAILSCQDLCAHHEF